MKSKNLPRAKKLLDSKLAAYSITATGALLAAPIGANAQGMLQNITLFSYDNGNTFISTPPSATPDLGGIDFLAANAQLGRLRLNVGRFSIAGQQFGRAFLGDWVAVDSHFNVSALGLGDKIAGKHFTAGSDIYLLASRTNGGAHDGNFLPAGANGVFTGYAAFEAMPSAGHTYYGWLRIKITNDADGLPAQVALVDKNGDGIYGAFDSRNDPNIADFAAGMTVNAVPEPSLAALGGLALLAFGARGVRELRRRRQAAAKTN